MDLENFGDNETDANQAGPSQTSSQHEMPLSNHDISLTTDDMNDVMKVLTDLDGYDVDTENSDKNIDSLTSVQDVSKIVDKSALANEKYSEAVNRQRNLEQRYSDLIGKINQFRCKKFGDHLTEEIATLRSICEKVSPPPAQPSPAITLPPPSLKLTSLPLRPPNIPEGVFLPTVPSPQVTPPLPTTPLSLNDIRLKEELQCRTDPVPIRASPPTTEEKKRSDEILGQLGAGLSHLIKSYDSDATESSSGGESCDELDDMATQSKTSQGETNPLAIRKRAKWRWLKNRSRIVSRWSWLSAQVADLEYRIRQQTEFLRQVRLGKGQISLCDPPPLSSIPPPIAVQKDPDMFVREDSSGRKIVIKLPSQGSQEIENEIYLGCARTRALRPFKRRRIVSTRNFYRKSSRAMKESTIQCSCIQPNFWCAICFGRTNHVQVPDPVSQEPGRIIALLDHSYHQVLSTKNDVPLEIQISHKLKSRDWVSKYISSSQMSKSARKSMDLSDSNLTAKERLEAKRQLKRKLKEERLEAKKRKKAGKKRLRLLKTEKRRKSITVSHHSDLAGATMTDLISDSGDQTPQPYQAMSTLAMAEQLRRKRETAFDIDNIVIPYSMAASVRVEKLKYKEILTPTWRLVDEDSQDVERSTDDLGTSVPSQSSSAAVSGSIEEDLSDLSYEIRHAKAEVEERKRWQLPVNKSGRSRSRRQDSRAEASSGYNTPDPMSPAPVVDSVEVSTRPSSPILNEDSNTSFSLSRIRRRTLSATKSRDRNPSEDTQSSRCTTPVIMEPLQEDVPPYDSRKFPLTDEEFNAMMADMPEGQEIEPGSESLPPPTAQDCPETETRASPVHQVSSRSSTADEGEETDPDWCEEDPGDPEWTGKNETPTVPVSSSTSGKRRVSISTKLP